MEHVWNAAIAIGTGIIALGTCIAAICAVLTARYAKDAASTWESTLRNQNIDNCISALAEIRGALGALNAGFINKSPRVWSEYDDLWRSHRRFDVAYSVMRRYEPTLTKDRSLSISERFHHLRAKLLEQDAGKDVAPDDVRVIADAINTVISASEKEVGTLR